MFRERGNQMTPRSGTDMLAFGVAGLAGLLLVASLLGVVATRLACGQWVRPTGVLAPLQFAATGDPAAFGVTAAGCAAPVWGVFTLWAVALVVGTVGLVVVIRAVQTHRQSDKHFISRLKRREGLAKRSEIQQAVGRKAATAMTGKVRPTIPTQERTPEQGNYRLGESEGVDCWIGLEESIVLIGPPRSGKGVNEVVGAILDAPGPVITTSSRADNYAMTAPIRAQKGPVTVFDPQGLTGKATTLKWSPITGCEKPQTANQRATSLIGAAGLSADGNNAEWRAPAIMIMQCLLHAAALDGAGVDVLMRWGNSPSEAKAAVQVLRRGEADGRGAGGWASALEAEIDADPKMRANKWFGVSNAVQGLSVDSVRDALNPKTRDETFDIDEFIARSGTLYIIGTKTGGASAGPFLIAMMDAITERGRELAAKSVGNRLDPPLKLELDEIANISGAWEGLVALMADGGGVGISVTAVFQSLAQVRNAWGEQAAAAIFDAATVKILLGGASNTTDLEVFQRLSGEREIIRSSQSRQKDGSSVSDQIHDKNVIEVSELRRLPFSWAIVLWRKQRPIFMRLRPHWKRADAAGIKSANTLFAQSLLDDRGAEAAWEEAVSPGKGAPGKPLAALSPGSSGAGETEKGASPTGDVTVF